MLRVGTSGWQYRDWRGAFYPPRLATARWLEYYATQFPTVEANSPFYRLPERATFEQWAARTPDRFTFAVKASRYLTHVRRLREPAEPVARLVERAAGLGPKLGPVLLQLPPTLPADVTRLEETLAAFPAGVRVAFEPREESWDRDAVHEVLRALDVAWCWWDRRNDHGRLVRTASWCYLRLHEGRTATPPGYGRHALGTWAERLAAQWGDDPDGYVFFNNDARACAVHDARTFRRLATRAGLSCARRRRAERRGTGRVTCPAPHRTSCPSPHDPTRRAGHGPARDAARLPPRRRARRACRLDGTHRRPAAAVARLVPLWPPWM